MDCGREHRLIRLHRKNFFNCFRLQSAMEYLMTYGWAILIIAVVLAALFQIGVFSGSSLTPKAQPGSCKVIRPNGPGTTTYMNLAGVCTGQLPQFVAQLNGASSYVNAGNIVSLNALSAITVTAWVKFSNLDYVGNSGKLYGIAGKGAPDSTTPNAGWWFSYDNRNNRNDFGYTCFGNSNGGWSGGPNNFGGYTYNFANNVWYQLAFTVGSSTARLYVNGVQLGADKSLVNLALNDPTNNAVIAAILPGSSLFKGIISNVQIYNTSLSSGEIQGLYAEGMGGAPARLQNLVGWWPLNGDANDYSGNGNNGAATSVVFTSTWSK